MEQSQELNCAVIVTCAEVPVSERVVELVRRAWKTDNVRVITDAAPERAFAEAGEADRPASLRRSIDEALQDQTTKWLALVAHSGCKMNAGSYSDQMEMLRRSVDYLNEHYPDTKIGGIWVDKEGNPLKVEL